MSAALETARQILSYHGESGPIPAVQVPREWPRVLLVAARILLIPIVAITRVIAWCEERFSPYRPGASHVHRTATPRLQRDLRPVRER